MVQTNLIKTWIVAKVVQKLFPIKFIQYFNLNYLLKKTLGWSTQAIKASLSDVHPNWVFIINI